MPLPTANDKRIRALPANVRAAVLKALAKTPDLYGPKSNGGKKLPVWKLWKEALVVGGFERFDYAKIKSWALRPIAPAAEVTKIMRALVEIIVDVPGLYFDDIGLPSAAWMQRDWLEAKGLFAGKKTFFDEFRFAFDANKAKAIALVTKLPLAKRLPLIGDLMLCREGFDYELAMTLPAIWPKLKTEGRTWGPAMADRLVGLFEDPRGAEIDTAMGPRLRGAFAVTVLLAIVRAKIAIEPRWDILFSTWHLSPSPALWEILNALPEDRREVAVERCAQAMDLNSIDQWAPELLKRFPSARALKYVSSKVDYAKKPREFLKQLPSLGEQPKIAKLTLAGKPIRKLADLDAIGKKQLEVANRLYGGTRMTAAAIMKNTGAEEPEGEPQIVTSHLERGKVLDAAKKHLYDYLFYNVDSGTFFAKGTTKVVAEVIQFGVTSKDKSLQLALTDAMSPPKKKKR